MNEFLNKLLTYYSLSEKEYLKLKSDKNEEIFDFLKSKNEFLVAKKIIKESIKNKEKILIYGDYDCDGILATSIIYNLIKKYDDYKCGYYIPFREKDGYGITKENIDKFLELNYELFILVDNGVTLKENIEYLKEKNKKIIIIDHHEFNESNKSNPDVLIHWKNIDEFKNNISAGALSALFSYCYLDYQIDPYLMSLGMITVISDLMPLIDFNHDFVKYGLKLLNKYKFNEICLLLNKYNDINEEDISLSLIPKINSIGRIVKDNNLFKVVKYFLLDKDKPISFYYDFINLTNEKRKEMIASFDENNFEKFLNKENFVYLEGNIEDGLIGLIANKLMEKYNKPAFILTNNNENTLKGSIRSKKGFDVISFFNFASSTLLRSGGHEFAGGFEIEKENIDKFIEKIDEFSSLNKFIEQNEKTIPIKVSDLNQTNYELIESFAPFGKEFKKPLFKLEEVSVSSFKYSKDNNHIVSKLSLNSSLIYFNYPKEILSLDKVNLIGTIEENKFRNLVTYQLKVNKFEQF